MKFSCTQENLNRGLALVSHIASRNVHLPILHNVYIDAKEGGVELVATNLDIGVRVRVRGKIEEPGAFTVPAHVIASYVSLLSADRVDVEQEGGDLIVHAGNQHTKIRGESASEFPIIPEVSRTEPVAVPAAELRAALSQVLIASSRDSARPELTGVYVHWSGRSMTLVATDSYRLAERTIALASAVKERSFIVPGDSLQELNRVLPLESEGDVVVYCTDNQVLFATEDVELTTRLIEGVFPDYKQIIPQQHRTKVVVDRMLLVKAVKTAGLFSKTGIHDVNIHFSPEKQVMTLTSVNNQVGENVSKVEAEITGDSNSTIFNHRYLLDGISNITTPTISLQLIDNVTPGVFRPHGDAEQSYLYIIMPIKQ